MKDFSNFPVFEKVAVVDISNEGKSVAKVENLVIFVSDVIPGDVVDIKVYSKKKKFYEGIPTRFHEFSKFRVEPFCQHFGICGGCRWQQMSYAEQLKFKQKHVFDCLTRIAKTEIQHFKDILPCQNIDYYRNKLEFTFASRAWLTHDELQQGIPFPQNVVGFHIPAKFSAVFDIEHCHLQAEPSNKIRNELKNFARKNNFSFYDLRKQEGFLRNLIIRTSTIGEVMLMLVFGKNDDEKIAETMKHLQSEFPEITSLYYVINLKQNDSINDLPLNHFSGREFIVEKMQNLKFNIGPKSFFQTNSEQAVSLYNVVKKMANISGNEIVYDLYCGTGTIACYLAENAKKVIGIEQIPGAVNDAKINAKTNNIFNTTFFSGVAEKMLNENFFDENGFPDVVVVDPPRAGLHPKVIHAVMKAKPQKIVYVSCNPSTQARDINLLKDDYFVAEVQPVDMFPHTTHVENVVLMTRK